MRRILFILTGLVMLTACGKKGQSGTSPAPTSTKGVSETEGYTALEETKPGQIGAGAQNPTLTTSSGEIKLPERMVAYTVIWEMETEKFNDVADRIVSVPEKYGGYIVSSNIYKTENSAWTADIIMKVPSDRLKEAEEEIKGIKEAEVITYNKTSQDITEEYLDLSIRLENKRRLLERMRSLLLKANSVREAMEVENEIARITEEIERMEGRMRFLQSITSYSQIQITLHEPYPTPLGQEGGPLKIMKKSFEVAATLFTYVTAAMVVIAGGLLPLVILALIIWLIIWGIIRSRRAKRAKASG
ncbi:MAG: DUF4349 domain-containing protein [candidate division WOR-3 bacterium]